jgi:hypothetical protein
VAAPSCTAGATASLDIGVGVSADGPEVRDRETKASTVSRSVGDVGLALAGAALAGAAPAGNAAAGAALTRRSALVVSKGSGGRSLVRDRTLLWHPVQSLASTRAWCGM